MEHTRVQIKFQTKSSAATNSKEIALSQSGLRLFCQWLVAFCRAAICNGTHCGSACTYTSDLSIRKSSSTISTVGGEGPAARQSIDWRAETPPCGLQPYDASVSRIGCDCETNDVSKAEDPVTFAAVCCSRYASLRCLNITITVNTVLGYN